MNANITSDRAVVWATDGSAGAEAALNAARRLLPESHFVAVHCDQCMGLAIELVIRTGHTSPADAVAAVATEQNADAIVCGTRGHMIGHLVTTGTARSSDPT